MALAIVQFKSGNTGTARPASTNVTVDTGTTAGNLLVLAISADAYFTSAPSGWTQNANSQNQTFFGQYVYTRTASAGTTSWSIPSPGGAAAVAWVIMEISGAHAVPFDLAAAQFAQSSATTYTSASLTPTSGERLLIAAFAGSLNSTALQGVSGWTNSFTERAESWTGRLTGDNINSSVATRTVVADGSTSYSTGVTWDNGATPQARGAIILAIKADNSNTPPTADAGSNQTVAINSTVTLHGSGNDLDGTIATYAWQQLTGTSVVLSDSAAAAPTFTAPATSGVLTFGLTVTDNLGATSTQDSVTITVASITVRTAAKIRIGGVWTDKTMYVRRSGVWEE